VIDLYHVRFQSEQRQKEKDLQEELDRLTEKLAKKQER